MSYEELIFENLDYDDGHGVKSGELIVEVKARYEDARFDAHGLGGVLKTFGGSKLEFDFISATFFKIGNNGVELGQEVFDSLEDIESKLYVTEQDILEKLREEVSE